MNKGADRANPGSGLSQKGIMQGNPGGNSVAMASGREMQLTRQIGEHLVAAELGRLGYVAAPFAGNVPLFDLLAANPAGQAVPVQVKAIRTNSWQFKVSEFLDIEFQKDGRQLVRGPAKLSNPKLICIFVQLGSDRKKDRFFVFKLRDLQRHFLKTYKSRLRPKNPQSLHCAIWIKDLKQHENNWDLVSAALGRVLT
ncbi:MAG TPA: hypothetical protein VFI23_19460 [Rhizomicrobium sp.]|nr:hypothetical protein [Rhizomicrobium sp.]